MFTDVQVAMWVAGIGLPLLLVGLVWALYPNETEWNFASTTTALVCVSAVLVILAAIVGA